MSEDITIDRTLLKNKVKEFLLRIDFVPNENINLQKIVERLSKYFDTTEMRQASKFQITFTNNSSEFQPPEEAFEYVLTSKTKSISMTFSDIQNAFWIESVQYRNNSVYKDMVKKTITTINDLCCDVEARRIGLRYVNEFVCDKQKDISKIFDRRLASIIKYMLHDPAQSRLIGMEEYNYEEYKMRLQYGIPNKFYPSSFSTYDLLLDIDSYAECSCGTTEWEENISRLNHAAYDRFMKEINPKYLQGLK